MRASCLLLIAPLVFAPLVYAQRSTPDYTQSSIVHSATGISGTLAPNTIGTIYGLNLAAATRALQPQDVVGGFVPIRLSGTGTEVQINQVAVPIYYASPNQVNFLVPVGMRTGPANLSVSVNGISGVISQVMLASAVPGVFATAQGTAAAVLASGQLISRDHPAAPGDWVILYATGLGECAAPIQTGRLASGANALIAPLRIWLDTLDIEPAYAGLAPGYAGLYQVNFQIPVSASENPLIRIETGGAVSPGIVLPIRKRG